MVGNETPSYPITGEPVKAEALENTPPMVMKAFTNGEFAHHDEYNHDAIPVAVKHIDYALEVVGKVIDGLVHAVEVWGMSPAVDIGDLTILQHHLINAKYSVPTAVGLTPVAELIEASDAIDAASR